MSTFVLRREYNLQLPNNYVEIDRDEMEYVDGGGSVTLSISVAALIGMGVGFASGVIAGAICTYLGGGVIASTAAKFITAAVTNWVAYVIAKKFTSARVSTSFWIPGPWDIVKHF